VVIILAALIVKSRFFSHKEEALPVSPQKEAPKQVKKEKP
jgi:hypothetical protein